MKEYRRGSHSIFQLHIHMVWCTKYRKKVLKDDVGVRMRELCRQISSDMGVEILSGVVAKDHVHGVPRSGGIQEGEGHML
jgi:putative transposase